MFKFCVSDDIVSLIFENDNMEIHCYPENPDRLYKSSYSAKTCDGHFEFSFNNRSITFRAAKYEKGEGGSLSIYVEMTSEIKKSLDDALNEWREYLNEREKDGSDIEYESG